MWLALGFVVGAIGLLALAARLVRPSESWEAIESLDQEPIWPESPSRKDDAA